MSIYPCMLTQDIKIFISAICIKCSKRIKQFPIQFANECSVL